MTSAYRETNLDASWDLLSSMCVIPDKLKMSEIQFMQL